MENNIKNMRIFEIKYLGATDCKGSRIKINDKRFNKSKTIPRTYEHINEIYDAIDYLTRLGIDIKFKGEFDNTRDILISDNFEIQII